MELGRAALRAQRHRRPARAARVDPVVQAHGRARLHGSGRALRGEPLRARPHPPDRSPRPRRAQALPRRPTVLTPCFLSHRLHGRREGLLRRAVAVTVIARRGPPSLASRATAGLRSAEARSAKAEAPKQSRATGTADVALDCFASLAMTKTPMATQTLGIIVNGA